MKYTQTTKGFFKTQVDLDLQDTGFQYVFMDKRRWQPSVVEESFIAYSGISNQKSHSVTGHSAADSRTGIRMTLIMMTIIVCAMLIFWRVGFTTKPVPIAYQLLTMAAIAGTLSLVVYKQFSEYKIIQIKNGSGFFTILDDKQANTILQDIWKHRDHYLRKKFIDDDHYKNLTAESVEYLFSIKTITEEEAERFKTFIEKGAGEKVGFAIAPITELDETQKS